MSGSAGDSRSQSVPPDAPQGPAANSPGRSDEQAAQSYWESQENWKNDIEDQIGELQEAITHVIRSQNVGRGRNAHEQGNAPGPAQGQQEQTNSIGGQSGSASPTGQPGREPERAPTPEHWWFRPILGR